MSFVVLVLACASSDTGDDSALPAGEAATPRHPDAEWTAEEVATQIKEAIRFGVPMTTPLVTTFQDMLLQGDELCPGEERLMGALEEFSAEGCTAGSGYWYQGVGSAAGAWLDDDGDGIPEGYLEAMKTDGSMRDAEGNTFQFGGDMNFYFSGEPMGEGTFEARFLGTYAYPAAEAPWLVQGASSALYVDGTLNDRSEWTMTMNGGFTVAGASVSFIDATVNLGCAPFPTGTVGIRDAEGYWYDLIYDETTCDSCGEVWFDHSQALGRACVDITPPFLGSAMELSARIFAPPEGP